LGVVLERVLSSDEVATVRTILSGEAFLDGRATSDLASKNNLQLPTDVAAARRAGEFVAEHLAAHERFQHSFYPAAIVSPIFSRYEPGMEYPQHIDSALIAGRRADVSVTVFLSDPDQYEGGELEIDTGNSERRYKLPAGDAIAYPTTTLHRVAKVTHGLREAAVIWVQSMVRDPHRRQLLAELGAISRALPPGPYSERVLRSHANLERMWLEP
jgi:PKHD-type hydroxylase